MDNDPVKEPATVCDPLTVLLADELRVCEADPLNDFEALNEADVLLETEFVLLGELDCDTVTNELAKLVRETLGETAPDTDTERLAAEDTDTETVCEYDLDPDIVRVYVALTD